MVWFRGQRNYARFHRTAELTVAEWQFVLSMTVLFVRANCAGKIQISTLRAAVCAVVASSGGGLPPAVHKLLRYYNW